MLGVFICLSVFAITTKLINVCCKVYVDRVRPKEEVIKFLERLGYYSG